ncbi:MAG: ScyD/ScyE family protein [Candidatus Limnocylindrales bacterium]
MPASTAAASPTAGQLGALFGLSTSKDGSLLLADASQGIVSIKNGQRSLVAALPGATDVDAVGAGDYYAITGGGEPGTGAASLYRVSKGHAALVADLGAFEATINPDAPEVNPNPFDVEVLNGGGVLVSDAGGNDILYVDNKGRVDWVATLPEEVVSTANAQSLFGCPETFIPDFQFLCDIPAMPAQPVATSIAIGPDGAVYAGELKGFPGPTGESRIWRIERGTLHAHCGTPGETRCSIVGDGFTSIIDLQFGPDHTLYVTEFDEASWAAVEILGAPTGGTIDACAWGSFPFSCTVVKAGVMMPTATTVDRKGQLWTTTWSLVPGSADVVAIP